MNDEQVLRTPQRSSSCKSTNMIIPSFFTRSSSLRHHRSESISGDSSIVVIGSPLAFQYLQRTRTGVTALLRSLLHLITFPYPVIVSTCRSLTTPTHVSMTPPLGRKVTGTLFGNRRGQVSFAVQDDPRSDPVMIVELAVLTSELVREMTSGMVRIALECEKGKPTGGRPAKLMSEPAWTMYCNGRKCGHALKRPCSGSDSHVLGTIRNVSVGAGVIPVIEDGRKVGTSEGELLYMRARFERIVGTRDSEAFYMMNPDGNGGAELSIFLLRI